MGIKKLAFIDLYQQNKKYIVIGSRGEKKGEKKSSLDNTLIMLTSKMYDQSKGGKKQKKRGEKVDRMTMNETV